MCPVVRSVLSAGCDVEQHCMKRLLDIAASTAGLLVAAPLIALAMIAVRRESPGPAIFRQTRVGRDGRLFTCYKLRTMYAGTGDMPSHMASASAVTPLGARLRRWKIDELPQLLNVLIGDMSLVGPRPCLPTQTELIQARRSRGILAVRPGITGLGQVKGVDMSDPEQLAALDAQYVADQSFFGDLRLILMTIAGSGRNLDHVKPAVDADRSV